MPKGTRGTGLGSTTSFQGSRADGLPSSAEVDKLPTLASLLDALTSSVGDEHTAGDPLTTFLRTMRNAPPAEPLERPVADTLRAGMLRAIRRELGSGAGDLALVSLQGTPLTKRTMEQVLQAAVSLSAARKAALASAGLAAVTGGQPAVDSEQGSERHEMLLAYCAELVGSGLPGASGRLTLDADAQALHDRVRAFLERQGRWPITDDASYEVHAKPAALVMATWDEPE